MTATQKVTWLLKTGYSKSGIHCPFHLRKEEQISMVRAIQNFWGRQKSKPNLKHEPSPGALSNQMYQIGWAGVCVWGWGGQAENGRMEEDSWRSCCRGSQKGSERICHKGSKSPAGWSSVDLERPRAAVAPSTAATTYPAAWVHCLDYL